MTTERAELAERLAERYPDACVLSLSCSDSSNIDVVQGGFAVPGTFAQFGCRPRRLAAHAAQKHGYDVVIVVESYWRPANGRTPGAWRVSTSRFTRR